MLAFLFYAFLAYLLFRFIFGFLLPIIRTTRQVKRSFREMNERMAGFNPGADPRAAAQQQAANVGTRPPSKDDYIDFEEIKD